MRLRKALVTGCCGFIGSHVTQQLVEAGWYVEGVDDLSNGDFPDIKIMKEKLGFLDWNKFRDVRKRDAKARRNVVNIFPQVE